MSEIISGTELLCAGVVPYRVNYNRLEFLLVRHVHGHWEFPKGKVEPGETIIQAALRELSEEAGVAAQLIPGFSCTSSYVYVDTHGLLINKTIHFFVGLVTDDQGVISPEHTDLAWLLYEHARVRLTYAESKVLLDKVFLFLTKQ